MPIGCDWPFIHSWLIPPPHLQVDHHASNNTSPWAATTMFLPLWLFNGEEVTGKQHTSCTWGTNWNAFHAIMTNHWNRLTGAYTKMLAINQPMHMMRFLPIATTCAPEGLPFDIWLSLLCISITLMDASLSWANHGKWNKCRLLLTENPSFSPCLWCNWTTSGQGCQNSMLKHFPLKKFQISQIFMILTSPGSTTQSMISCS